MKKIMWMILLFYAGFTSANGAEIKNCNIGADPWFLGRQVDSNVEVEYVLTKPLVVESLNSKGKPSGRCILPAGEHIVASVGFDTSVQHPFATREDKMKLAWVKRCGNPIVSRFHFVVPQKQEAVVEAQKSLFVGVDPDFNRTRLVPNQPEPVAEEAPPVRRVVRYVIMAPRAPMHYGGGYSYGTPSYVPQQQYTPSQYYMSPNIRYPEPPPYVPPPQQVIVPPGGHSGGQGGSIVPPGGYSGR